MLPSTPQRQPEMTTSKPKARNAQIRNRVGIVLGIVPDSLWIWDFAVAALLLPPTPTDRTTLYTPCPRVKSYLGHPYESVRCTPSQVPLLQRRRSIYLHSRTSPVSNEALHLDLSCSLSHSFLGLVRFARSQVENGVLELDFSQHLSHD